MDASVILGMFESLGPFGIGLLSAAVVGAPALLMLAWTMAEVLRFDATDKGRPSHVR